MQKVEGRAVEGWRRGSEGEGVGRGGWRISSLLTHTHLPTTKSAIATRYVCNCMHKYNQISKSAISNLSAKNNDL